jgi:AcrR family transcriptional regulator
MATQDKIIHAFLDLLASNNYEQITITEVMNHCRLPRTYYYEFFDNKGDLAQEAFYTTMYPIFHLFAITNPPTDKLLLSV